MKEIQPVSINGVEARLDHVHRIYEGLSVEEKAEVDEFNQRVLPMNLRDTLAETAKQPDGKHPMAKYIDRYEKENKK